MVYSVYLHCYLNVHFPGLILLPKVEKLSMCCNTEPAYIFAKVSQRPSSFEIVISVRELRVSLLSLNI